MKLSLSDRLMRYFRNNPLKWIPSGEIQRLVLEHTNQLPRTAVRRLQELAEEGKLESKLLKRHTHYRLAQTAPTLNSAPSRAQLLKENAARIAWFENYQKV